MTTILFSCTKVGTETQGTLAYEIETKAGVNEMVFTAYDYCEKEGFWANLGPLEERFEATQIPVDKLSGYSTKELFILCLNNPLTLLYPAYNNELVAIDLLADRINVFQALEKRDDVADAILDVYSNIVIDVEQTKNCIYSNGRYSLSLLSANFISLYIASARIPSLFDVKNTASLRVCAERLYEMKRANPAAFSWFSFSKELLLREEIKKGEGLTPEMAKRIYMARYTPSLPTKSFDSDEYRGESAYDPVFPRTKNNKPVYGIIIDELFDSERLSIDRSIRNQYSSGATFLETSSATYNCHSYAWNIVDNPYNYVNCWINRSSVDSSQEENLAKYWTNDYYSEVPNSAIAEKIYYRYSDHSAIPSYGDYYISKWGNGPVMEHLPDCCPYLVSDMHYYAHCSDGDNGGDGDGNDGDGNDGDGNDGDGNGGNGNDGDGNGGNGNGGNGGNTGVNPGGSVTVNPEYPSNSFLTISVDRMERLGRLVTYTTEVESNLTWTLFLTTSTGVEIAIESVSGAQYSTVFNDSGNYRLQVVCAIDGTVVATGNKIITL